MAGKREKPEGIVLKLRQVEVLQGQGKSVADAVRQIGVTVQTYYRWRKAYGGMRRHCPIDFACFCRVTGLPEGLGQQTEIWHGGWWGWFCGAVRGG